MSGAATTTGGISQPSTRCSSGPTNTAIPVLPAASSNNEDGKSIVIARTAAGHFKENGLKGAFYARLFNGQTWEKQYKLDTSDGTGGSDRRLSATFDTKAKVLHLVYTDGEKRLVYRTCKAPYGPSDWSEPDYPVQGKSFTQCIGLDRSVSPARPVIVYGLQKRSDGGRLHAGELYLIRHDGSGWTAPLLVSEKGRDDNWYPSLIEDCSGDIGILYLRNFYRPMRPKDIEAPWDVMFAKIEHGLPLSSIPEAAASTLSTRTPWVTLATAL